MQGLSCLGRKRVLLVSLLRSVGKSLCYFYPGNCIAFSVTSASDNTQKLVPRDQFCFLCSTPRLLCQEPESVNFDLHTWHLEYACNTVRLAGMNSSLLVRCSGDIYFFFLPVRLVLTQKWSSRLKANLGTAVFSLSPGWSRGWTWSSHEMCSLMCIW